MDFKESKRFLIIAAIAFIVVAVLIYAVAYEQFRYETVVSDTLSASTSLGEIVDGITIVQSLDVPAEYFTALSVMAGTYNRNNTGVLHFELTDAMGSIAGRASVDVSELKDGKYTEYIDLEEPIVGREGEELTLTITSEGCQNGNAVTLYAGSSVSAGRFNVAKSIDEEDLYRVNEQLGIGRLCIKAHGRRELNFYRVYWIIVSLLAAVFGKIGVNWWKQAKDGHNNPLVAVCTLVTRYRFLIKQLVIRDFKAKYKRSALGMFWSFLNPLMTMMVQYIVFSTLFRSDTPNYAVYLLTGIVFFNFFNQTVTAGLKAITDNAPLIKKVYLPKYVYPLTRVISSLINFIIGLIPLLLVMLFTHTAFTPALFLLIYNVLCMALFISGVVLILCTANTFFQDTEFLWGVLGMMWTYVTPIFYPETIIPEMILPLYRLNPMYQFITFARTCIIDGISPAPSAYFMCLLLGAGVFALGAWIFKKKQDEFILQL